MNIRIIHRLLYLTPTSEAAPEDTASKWLRRFSYSWCRSSILPLLAAAGSSEASDLAGRGLTPPFPGETSFSGKGLSSAPPSLSREMTMSRSRSARLSVAMASSMSRPRSR